MSPRRIALACVAAAITAVAAAPPAHALTEAQCDSAGNAFRNAVAPYPHSTPSYLGTKRLDVYRSTAATRGPLVLYLHGGGWGGENWQIRCDGGGHTAAWMANLLPQGFTIASVQYTPATEPPPTLGGTADNVVRQVREIKYAIKWLRTRASTYNFDPSKVVITGGSAGGHLAALAALTGGEALYEPTLSWARTYDAGLAALPSGNSSIQFGMPVSGIYDIRTYTDPWGLVPRVFGCWRPALASWRPCSETTLQRSSPVAHVTPDDPKLYLWHGAGDGLVPPAQARQMANTLCASQKLTHYTLAQPASLYQHNLEPGLSENPYLGAIIHAGLRNTIASNCGSLP
ncbi:MAG: alpha/beta hydrolase fold domain-containing protein [Solirubrobacteraceae bacterium]|nr:alpha/beta hydrolase fold domain-containing protein [Solirubrobacteraceae bacterium]